MPRLRPILFFNAIITAVECSAALPITAITITPTKTSVSPSADSRGLHRADQKLGHQRDQAGRNDQNKQRSGHGPAS